MAEGRFAQRAPVIKIRRLMKPLVLGAHNLSERVGTSQKGLQS